MATTFLKKFLCAGIMLTASSGLTAQKGTTLVKHLETSSTGGKVTIHQDTRLNARIGKVGEGSNLKQVNNVSYIVTPGFRIQVFSGNEQRKSKQEATQKEKMIKEIDPQIDTEIKFDSPFWRLRVGNYRTYEEADMQLRLLKKGLPQFGKEMYIVPDEVRFPIYSAPVENGI